MGSDDRPTHSGAASGRNGGGWLFALVSEAQGRQIFLVLAVALAAGSAFLAFLFGSGVGVGRLGEDALNAGEAVAVASGQGLSYLFGPQAVAATQPPLLSLLLLPALWLGGGAVGGAVGGAAGGAVGGLGGSVVWMHAIAAGCTFAFVLVAYGALRRVLVLPPAVSFAAVAGLALHPVIARFGGAVLADTLAAALALGALVAAALTDERIEARKWVVPEARLQVPVVMGSGGPMVLGPGGILAGGEMPGGTLGVGTAADPTRSQVPGARGSEPGQPRGSELGAEAAEAAGADSDHGPGIHLSGIAVIPRSGPTERRGLAAFWHGWGLADWWPVALLAALAVLARYETIVAVVAIGLALLAGRRWREAAGLVGLTVVLLLPWAMWAAVNWGASAGAAAAALDPLQAGVSAAPELTLKNFPSALWQGLGRVLPGFLIPQAFIAGYPLGTEGAPHMARVPVGIVAVWGLLVSASLAGPLWRLRTSSSLGARAAGFFALGMLGVTLLAAGFNPAAGWDFMARSLLPAAPLFIASVWMWKAGEHRYERAAAERFKGLIALGWMAAVVVFSPVALGPVREDLKRAQASQVEQAALWRAIGELTAPGDLVAAARPADVWLNSGRHAVGLPLAVADLPVAVRRSGARWVVSEPLVVGGRDLVVEALTKAAASEPDWARLVFTSPGRKVALFQVLRPAE